MLSFQTWYRPSIIKEVVDEGIFLFYILCMQVLKSVYDIFVQDSYRFRDNIIIMVLRKWLVKRFISIGHSAIALLHDPNQF